MRQTQIRAASGRRGRDARIAKPPMILVTGADGFIGSHLVRALLSRGRPVRALCLPGSHAANLQGLDAGLEIRRGDLRDEASLETAMADVTHIAHLGAWNNFWVPSRRLVFDVNLGGTRRLCALAKRHGCRRFLHCSTAGIRAPQADELITEKTRPRPEHIHGAYERSKFEAERWVSSLISDAFPAVIVCPTAPLGAHDTAPTPPGAMVRDFLTRRIPFELPCAFNLVDVEAVAEAMAEALLRDGVEGETFILGGENVTLRQVLDLLEEITGVTAPRRSVPHWLALIAAGASHAAATLFTRRPPRVTLPAVQLTRSRLWYDCARAKERLGLRDTDLRAALTRSVEWFRAREAAVERDQTRIQ